MRTKNAKSFLNFLPVMFSFSFVLLLYGLWLHLLLSGCLSSSTSKIILNASLNHEEAKVDDPVKFSEMLVTKIKELLKGTVSIFYGILKFCCHMIIILMR